MHHQHVWLPLVLLAIATLTFGTARADGPLYARDLDGNRETFEAYYDPVLDVTWYDLVFGSQNWSSAKTDANTWSAGDPFLEADLDCNGIVNTFDLSIMRAMFGLAPGPRGAVLWDD